DAQFCYMVHPTRNIDEPARVFSNNSQMLTLRIVDLTAAAVEDHAGIAAYSRQRRSQVMRDVGLHMPPQFDQRIEMVSFFEDLREIRFGAGGTLRSSGE